MSELSSLPRALVAVSLVAGCASWDRLDLTTLPNEAAFPGAPAIVLLDELRIRFLPGSGDPIAEVTDHRRVRVLRTEGADVARIVVGYHVGLSPLVAFEARAIGPDGVEHRYHRGDASDVAAFGKHVLYSDGRALLLEPAASGPGSVVEWRATRQHLDVRLEQFHQEFGGELPVAVSRLVVAAPTGWSVEHLARRLDERLDWLPEKSEAAGWTTWSWERRDIPATPPERAGPPATAVAPMVQVRLAAWTGSNGPQRGFADAREHSAWMYRLHDQTALPSPELSSKAQLLVEGLDDPRTKAERLYTFVRDTVTYCAVEIGYGGWRPHAARDVYRYGYGDCKDKANLLRAMLLVVGIPARLVEIYAHDGYPRPFGLPGIMGNFNHAIIAVDLPSGPVFADPTSRTAPFGRLPAADEDADCLPISRDGAPLDHTPAAEPDASTQLDELELILSPAGGLRGTFLSRSTGHFSDKLRRKLLEATDAKAELARDHVLHGAKLEELTIDGRDPRDASGPVSITGRISTDGLSGSGTSRVLRFSDLVRPLLPSLGHGARRDPVVLGFRRHVVQKVRILLPERFEAPSLPAPFALDAAFARYRLTWRLDGRSVEVARDLTQLARVIPSSDYPSLIEFLDAVNAAEARGLVVHSTGAP